MDDEFWSNIVNDTSKLIQDHNSDPFAKNVVFAVLNMMSSLEATV